MSFGDVDLALQEELYWERRKKQQERDEYMDNKADEDFDDIDLEETEEIIEE